MSVTPISPPSPDAFTTTTDDSPEHHHPIVPEPRWYGAGLTLVCLAVFLWVRASRDKPYPICPSP